jgi:hypothetical protein
LRVLYLIQTYKDEQQIRRLVFAIRASDPDAVVMITHNCTGFVLEDSTFDGAGDVHVINRQGGSRIDFSLPSAYLAALDRAQALGIDYDWIVNLTGQGYPARPLGELRQVLQRARVDGFVDHHPLRLDRQGEYDGIWPSAEAFGRYGFQYHWRLTGHEPPMILRKALGAVRLVVNRAQPWIWLDTSYALQVGVRDRSGVIGPHFPLYGGSYYMTLTRRAAEHLRHFARSQPAITAHLSRMNVPSEVFAHTVLANNAGLVLRNEQHFFFDVLTGKRGRPAVLTADRYDEIVASGKFFARKVERGVSSELLDRLDQRLLGRSRAAPPSRGASQWRPQSAAA